MATKVNNEELQTASKALGVTPNDIKISAPVILYHGSGNNWVQKSFGILCVCTDNATNTVFLKMVDLNNNSVTLDQECYDSFDYQVLNDYFHCFEGDDTMIGLNFAERFDASGFARQIQQLVKMFNKMPPSVSTSQTAPKHTTTTSVDKNDSSPKLNNTAPKQKIEVPKKDSAPKETEKKGFFSKIFGGNKKETNPKMDRSAIKISGPKIEKFQHVSHIGFDPKKGFTEIPQEWKSIFEKAGISEEELKDKKTAKFLMKTIVAVEKQDLPPVPTTVASQTGTVPAPPSSSSKLPPPVPPTVKPTTVSSANVPPPPSGIVQVNVPPPPSGIVKVDLKSPNSPVEGGSGTGGGVSGGSQSSGDLLSQIKATRLKEVKKEDLPDVTQMAENDQNSLALSIAKAMEMRRGRVELSSSEDEDDDDWEL
ncbi:hypothetical protein ABK040_004885 [Willaertia magna]